MEQRRRSPLLLPIWSKGGNQQKHAEHDAERYGNCDRILLGDREYIELHLKAARFADALANGIE
jgi:hypothetical protein